MGQFLAHPLELVGESDVTLDSIFYTSLGAQPIDLLT
jgi:hypothetical protein